MVMKKLYELKCGTRVRIDTHIDGTFIKCDGMFAQVKTDKLGLIRILCSHDVEVLDA